MENLPKILIYKINKEKKCELNEQKNNLKLKI
jgi:hypothetical protein